MDYEEEQKSELEALEAIYPIEFKLISEHPITFRLAIRSETYTEEGDQGLCATIKFSFTPKYPEEVPEIEVMVENEEAEEDEEEVFSNLDEDSVSELQKYCVQQAEENTGMVMVFTIVSAAIEWLNNKWDRILKEKEEEAERKRVEEEEEEQKRFEGTRVTVQSFIAWKTAFDAEREALEKKKMQSSKDKNPVDSKKLTGKELFLSDKTLAESDLKFEDDDDAGPIDESLFEDMEDLDVGGDSDEN